MASCVYQTTIQKEFVIARYTSLVVTSKETVCINIAIGNSSDRWSFSKQFSPDIIEQITL